MKGYGSAAHGLRAAGAHLRVLVGEHDPRVAYLELGVTDLAAGSSHPHPLGCAEHRLVEVNRGGAAVDDEVGSYARVAIRDWVDHPLHLLRLGGRSGLGAHGTSPAQGRVAPGSRLRDAGGVCAKPHVKPRAGETLSRTGSVV